MCLLPPKHTFFRHCYPFSFKVQAGAQETTSINITVRNLTWVDFFLLLRPGEYCKSGTNTALHPFSIKDIQFFVVQQLYNATTACNSVLTQADFVSLLLTTHKNGVKGG